MNRRKAIGGFLAGLGAITGFAGYKWYDWHKAPDLAYLASKESLLDALAGTIIPDSTGSPGAGNIGSGRYIITMVRDCLGKTGQNRFIDGLREVEDFTKVHFIKDFHECSAADKVRILKNFESQGRALPGLAGKVQERYLGPSFFNLLRFYTVQGYCTSKKGATMGLAYVPVPGRYTGIVKLQSGQKSWATK